LTYLILNIDIFETRCLITLYYASNYITNMKSKKEGISYKIINQINTDGKTSFIDKIELHHIQKTKKNWVLFLIKKKVVELSVLL